jgi:hypothetical protein
MACFIAEEVLGTLEVKLEFRRRKQVVPACCGIQGL